MNEQTALSDDVIADTYAKASLDGLTSQIVAAYVSNNHITITEVENLIKTVRAALASPVVEASTEPTLEKPTPSQIKKSITPDALISFEDGKGYKTLRRHLTLRGITPEEYRAKWGLPSDYPMTSASYSEQRSALAKSLGLGQMRRAAAKTAPADEAIQAEPPAEKPAKRKKIGIAA